MRKGPDFEPTGEFHIMPPDKVKELLSVLGQAYLKDLKELEKWQRDMQEGFDAWCLTLRGSI